MPITKPGLVDEVHDRQPELVAEVDEAGHLVGGLRGQAAAEVRGIGCQHADRPAVEPRERGDERAAEARAELEHRAAVEDGVEDLTHLVRLAPLARDDRDEAPRRAGRAGRSSSRSAAAPRRSAAGRRGSAGAGRARRPRPPPRCRPRRPRSASASRRAPPCRAPRPSPRPRPAGRRRTAATSRARSPRSARPPRARRRARPRARAPPRRPARRDRFSTTSSQPGTNGTYVKPIVSRCFTLPPPPVPSTRRTSGRRRSCAIRSAKTIFCQIAASAAPPRTVKSSPWSTARRPSIRPCPTIMFAGRKSVSSPCSSYVPLPAIAPVSWKLPASNSRSTRSRTVSRPSGAGARRAPRRPSAARAPRGGGAPRARAPRSRRASLRLAVDPLEAKPRRDLRERRRSSRSPRRR